LREQRGAFYEATGALRDMVPNHILSLLSLVAMEPPVGFDAASVRTKKAEVFRCDAHRHGGVGGAQPV
jgi:glucose-6-phosphate 1-dehydrogenase